MTQKDVSITSQTYGNDEVDDNIDIVAGQIEALFADTMEVVATLANIGEKACSLARIKPTGIHGFVNRNRRKNFAAKVKMDIDNRVEAASKDAKEIHGCLLGVTDLLTVIRLHTNERAQHGIEKVLESLDPLQHAVAHLQFYNLVKEGWQCPDVKAIYQNGLDDYDSRH